MWANPREHDPSWHSPSQLEACARRGARSEAMVVDVLERAGAASPQEARDNHVLRRLKATGAALLIAAIIGGAAWLALDLTQWNGEQDRRDATDGDRSRTAANELSRFGPFRP
jgi:hypothetical protein